MTLNARAPTPAQTAAIEQWARGMLALQPTHPRSHYLMGSAAVVNSSEGAPSSLRDPQLHMVWLDGGHGGHGRPEPGGQPLKSPADV